jgi:hypothetical protein
MTTPPEQDRTPPPGARSDEPAMRASDDDRAATVHVIQDAVVRGLLTADEGSERMAAAWAAVHVRDLGPLTADLPAVRSARTAPGWGVLATMAVEQARSSLHGARSTRLSSVRVAAALAVVLLLVVLVGSLVGELLVDGPGRGGFHGH